MKIDQSFVRDIDHDPVKSAIVSAVVALSQAIGSTTVVEGVETLAQLEELESLGCDVAQGYYFARPVSAAAFGRMLTASASATAGATPHSGATASSPPVSTSCAGARRLTRRVRAPLQPGRAAGRGRSMPT